VPSSCGAFRARMSKAFRYADNAVQSQARSVILHGSIDGLAMREALIAVLTGSGLSFELGADRVDIRRTSSSN